MVVGVKRRSILVGLGFLMFMGIAVYFRLWAIDYNISSDDSDLLRKQFDIANREAMDESAEWRLKYDEEVDRVNKCLKELQLSQPFIALYLTVNLTDTPVRELVDHSPKKAPKTLLQESSQKVDDASSSNHKLQILKKENAILLERVETLKRELEDEKLKCNSRYMN